LIPLKKSLDDDDAVSVLVIGTEANMIYIMNSKGEQVLEKVKEKNKKIK